jgi:hypothetical protein
MPNLWIQSLKRFNEGKQMWCIPRRGTDMNDAVRRILMHKQQSHNDKVSLPINRFVEEHTRLIETLKGRNPALLKKEAKRQAEELNKELNRRPKKKAKVSKTISL